MGENILTIIPLHAFNEEIAKLLSRAINSVPNEWHILISSPKTLKETSNDGIEQIINNFSTKNIKILYKGEKNDFCTLVNNAVSKDYNWFTILEFDDEYSEIWQKNLVTEMAYKPHVSVFLPLEELIDYASNKFVAYGNEAPWASSFSNEIGYIDNDCLQDFFDFHMTGGLFNTADWLNCGGLKTSIKLTFWYEFLLRLTSSDKKVFVVPKLGYRHYVNRPSSLYDYYKNNITQEESQKWYKIAKEESGFKKDRRIKK